MSHTISIEVKEQVFEIMAFVTDSSQEARELIAKNFTLMGIIIGVLQHMTNQEKMTRLAALTLNNISNAMSGKTLIKEFESELVTIGFTDDSLAGIVANILADISSLWYDCKFIVGIWFDWKCESVRKNRENYKFNLTIRLFFLFEFRLFPTITTIQLLIWIGVIISNHFSLIVFVLVSKGV